MLNMDVALAEADRFTFAGCMVTRRSNEDGVGSDLRFSREFNVVKDLVTATDALWDGRWALDGPHDPVFEVRALGEALSDCPDWRETGIPRSSLLASPAIWYKNELISAPLAGFSNGWTAKATGRGNFADFLLSR
jgi:tRNA(Ile)-lysidine synthase